MSERSHKRVRVARELFVFREEFVVTSGRIDLVAMLLGTTDKKVFCLAEKNLFDPSVFQNVEGGVAQEPIAHRGGQVLEQRGVSRIGEVEEILAFQALLHGEDREVRALQMHVDDDDRQRRVEARCAGVAQRGARHIHDPGERELELGRHAEQQAHFFLLGGGVF